MLLQLGCIHSESVLPAAIVETPGCPVETIISIVFACSGEDKPNDWYMVAYKNRVQLELFLSWRGKQSSDIYCQIKFSWCAANWVGGTGLWLCNDSQSLHVK